MSHSQFHCTGRAYLDMHGLIFETSICYWQDQPGRGKRARRRGAGRAGGGGWGEADPREAREPREEGGAGKGARRAGRPDRPGPARGEDARPRDPPSGSARVAARRRHRAGGTRGGRGGAAGRRAAGRPALSLLHPARPGPHRGRPTRALGVRPSTRPRAGRGTPGGEDAATGPRRGKTGDPSRARASAPGRGRPLVRHASNRDIIE